MDLLSIAFGAWFGVSCYRLFEMFSIDAMHKEKGYDEAEAYGVSKGTHLFLSCVTAFGWPILVPYAYFATDKDDDG